MTQLEIENLMEAKNLPEQDRSKVRRLLDFLLARKRREPLNPKMKAWLLGENFSTERTGS